MGRDIHMLAEVRDDNGAWKKVENVFDDPHYDSENPESRWNSIKTDAPYQGRNYSLFSMLAGIPTPAFTPAGDGRTHPISEILGVPEDVSDEVLMRYTYLIVLDEGYDEEEDIDESVRHENSSAGEKPDYRQDRVPRSEVDSFLGCGSSLYANDTWVSGPDWHSASYLTLKQLEDYDWGRSLIRQKTVSLKGYCSFKLSGDPDSIPASYAESPISNAEMDKKVDIQNLEKTSDVVDSEGTVITWRLPYSEMASEFLETTLPNLRSLGSPEDVRIVFWFDN